MPFFSIVVPSYNRAEFLTDTLATILQQTFSDFEIIVVDDGSRDNTKDVISRFQQQDQRVRYIYQNNAERGAARNNGIRNAYGSFILFFDSDDQMKGNYLEKLYTGIKQYPNYNFYAAKYTFLDSGQERKSSMTPLIQKDYDIKLVLKGNPFACNFCIRKNNKELKLFNEDRRLATTEDWMFLVENLYSDKIFVFDFVGLSMVQHDGRSMQQNQMLIERRVKATQVLNDKLVFNEAQHNTIWAYTYYFCSIHAYLDNDQKQAQMHLKQAIELLGWQQPFIIAHVKYKVGRRLITKLKTLLAN